MPIKSPKQFGMMQAIANGSSNKAIGPSPQVAKEFINKTLSTKRKTFASIIAKNKFKK